jgi:hypothetical protein
LALGRLQHSAFRKYCPITVSKGEFLRHDAIGKYQVAQDGKIYYLKSEKLVAEFIANTFAYVRESEYSEHSFITCTPPPLVPASLFILGPPKSGKTMFAQRIAISLDLVYLNVPIVLEAILEGKEDSLLHDTVIHGIILMIFRLKTAWNQDKWCQRSVLLRLSK